jgi:CHAD domain-containing protein
LFATLGASRDSDVLSSGVAVELAVAGAPPLTLPPVPDGADPADAVRATDTQRTLLAWITWRAALLHAVVAAEHSPAVDLETPQPDASADGKHADDAPAPLATAPSDRSPSDAATQPLAGADSRSFHRNLARRLRRWHARIATDWKCFDELDEDGLHALRKRIKRQRYAVEFSAPLLRRRHLDRYLNALAPVQDRMGALNDLFVAHTCFQELATNDPASWFALGWLSARIAEIRASIKPVLARLAKSVPPAP